MTTCPNCGFLLELTRREQEGGAEFDTEKVIKSILSGEEKEFSFSAKNLYQTKEFKELKPEEQTEITQKIEQFKKDNQGEMTSYLTCQRKECGFISQLAPMTIIYSKSSEKIAHLQTHENIDNMIYDTTLPHTRYYTCKNSSCPSHTDPTKKDAFFFRVGTYNYQLSYICLTCKETWTIKN